VIHKAKLLKAFYMSSSPSLVELTQRERKHSPHLVGGVSPLSNLAPSPATARVAGVKFDEAEAEKEV